MIGVGRYIEKLSATVWLLLAGLVAFSVPLSSQAKVPGLQASFLYSPINPTEGQAVRFTDTSRGGPTSWRWDFGDGSVSAERNPTHMFPTRGLWRVTLTVANASGSRKATRAVPVARPEMKVAFTYSPKAPRPGETVRFTDTTEGKPTSWLWDFGDGAQSMVKDPKHAFAKEGTYVVTLRSVDSFGAKQAEQTINVSSASSLSPAFGFSPFSPVMGQKVQFTDASQGAPTSWRWHFDDGSTSKLENPTHTYSKAGSYTVNMTASTATESATASRTVTVAAGPPPVASFRSSPSAPVAGQNVHFKDMSTNSPAYWRWDFADGTASSNKDPDHVFAYPGYYNVTLTAANAFGSHSASSLVMISSADTLAADFFYTPDVPVLGQTVGFKDASTGLPASWLWSFGDGDTSTDRNPRHAYLDTGTFTVTLTVTSGTNTSTVTKTVTVVEEERDYPGPE